MANFVPDPNAPILIDFASSAGMREVSLKAPDLQKQSAEAMKNAMNTIHNTAQEVTDTIGSLAVKPSRVEVEFGITLKAEMGALIAKGEADAAFKVTLTWEPK